MLKYFGNYKFFYKVINIISFISSSKFYFGSSFLFN